MFSQKHTGKQERLKTTVVANSTFQVGRNTEETDGGFNNYKLSPTITNSKGTAGSRKL